MDVSWVLRCLDCSREWPPLEVRYRCECAGTLDVVHDSSLWKDLDTNLFDERLGSRETIDRSGVWRFRELVLPVPTRMIVTRSEGNTNLYSSPRLSSFTGLSDLVLKHEGENPTASFKDRGMTTATTAANMMGVTRVACASTGNTSASMASYAALMDWSSYVFIPVGKIAYGKLAQALAFGARTIQIDSDFDTAMTLVEQVCAEENIYLLNSINPYRIEGQKAIGFELLQQLGWEVPDWIVMPGGNLGNNTAMAKGMLELKQAGLIQKLPRLAVIQAAGANPLYEAFRSGKELQPMTPETVATAIRIGNPVSWKKSIRGIRALDGIVEQVTDQEILDAKREVDRAGIGAEPASCTTVAGAKKLVAAGIIEPDQKVYGILTGHLLKDPGLVVDYHRGKLEGFDLSGANAPIQCPAELERLLAVVRQ